MKNFYVSPEYSSETGLISFDRRPYQIEVLDEIGKKENEKIIIISATQMMKTIVMMIAIAHKIQKQPGPILFIMDTILNATKFSRQRLDPMIRDNYYLLERVEEVKPKKTDTVLMKKYIGGILNLVGANSATGLIFSSIKYLFLDEVDSYPFSIGEIGDVVELALRRTTEFEDRQIILSSSPGSEGQTRIWPEFENSDQRYYYVPCPHCNEYQKLEWGGPDKDYGIKWENDDPSTTYYLCIKCHEKIYNRDKYWMNKNGKWHKENLLSKIPGFHINRLYSPSSTTTWNKLVEQWLEAIKFSKQGDNERLKVFLNTVLATLWKPTIGLPETESLLQRIENYFTEDNILPEQVCYLTAGIDTQDNFLHIIIRSWGIGEESWLIMRKIIPGNPALIYIWNELDLLLQKPFAHPFGLNIYISSACIDTGGHYTDQVYEFVKNKEYRRIYGTKGSNVAGKPIAPSKPSFNNKGNIPLYIIGTDTAKEVVFTRLKIDKPGPGYYHFNQYADADYFEQLNSEKKVMKKVGGFYVPVWEEIPNRRHEDLDCEVLNIAALRISKPHLEKIYDDLKKKAEKLKEGTLFDKQNIHQKPPMQKNWVNKWKE